MKVLMINSVCGIRSTGRICTDLAEVLVENGYEVKIAYGRETVPENIRSMPLGSVRILIIRFMRFKRGCLILMDLAQRKPLLIFEVGR